MSYNMTYETDYDINGPINFFRLEHNKKVIYIFIDKHSDYNNLTDCSLISNPLNRTIDIDKFLIKFLKNTKESIDFYLPSNASNQTTLNKREIYVDQIVKLPLIINMENINFIYKKKEEHNKYIQKLLKIVSVYDKFYTIYDYDIHNIIFDMKKMLKYIKKIMKIKFIFKFKFKIEEHLNNVKKNINELINLLETNKENLIYGKNEKEFFELQSKIYNLLFIISNNIYFISDIQYNSSIIDLILKNDNKTIIYFPLFYGFNLIHILVKYFDFKITDRFFSDPFIDKNSIKELNKIINNLDMNYESLLFMEKIFVYKNKDDNIVQCINFVNMPMLT